MTALQDMGGDLMVCKIMVMEEAACCGRSSVLKDQLPAGIAGKGRLKG